MQRPGPPREFSIDPTGQKQLTSHRRRRSQVAKAGLCKSPTAGSNPADASIFLPRKSDLSDVDNRPGDGMVDIRDLKSRGDSPCGFKPRPGYSAYSQNTRCKIERAALISPRPSHLFLPPFSPRPLPFSAAPSLQPSLHLFFRKSAGTGFRPAFLVCRALLPFFPFFPSRTF